MMTGKSNSLKEWLVGAAVVGGVATGAVTAAGAASSAGKPQATPNALEAQRLHNEVIELTQHELTLQGSLKAHRTPSTTTAGVLPSTGAGAPSARASAPVAFEPASSQTTEPPGQNVHGTSTTAPVSPSDPPATEPSTTEPGVTTTTEPATTTTTSSTTTTRPDSGDDSGSAGKPGD